MKQYIILAQSITGVKGKQLLQDQICTEGEFIADHISDLITGGFIKDAAPASTQKKTNETKTEA